MVTFDRLDIFAGLNVKNLDRFVITACYEKL